MPPAAPRQLAGALPSFLLGGFAAVASATLLLSPLPAAADIQYIPNDQVTQQAKPLVLKKAVEKDKVWVLFIGGAIVLFTGTLAIENNDNFFPAIARANKAMAKMREVANPQPQAPPAVDIEIDPVEDDNARLLSATLEGLNEASAASSAREQKSKDAPAAEVRSDPAPKEADVESVKGEEKFAGEAESPAKPAQDLSLEDLEKELEMRKQKAKE